MDNLIIDTINQYHPVPKGQIYEPGQYEIDCELYKWLRYNYERCIREKSNFKQYLDLMDTITPSMTEEEKAAVIAEALSHIKGTIYYNDSIIKKYDLAN